MDKQRIALVFLIIQTIRGATAILPMLPLFVDGQFRATRSGHARDRRVVRASLWRHPG